jgi:hypothetical protein
VGRRLDVDEPAARVLGAARIEAEGPFRAGLVERGAAAPQALQGLRAFEQRLVRIGLLGRGRRLRLAGALATALGERGALGVRGAP